MKHECAIILLLVGGTAGPVGCGSAASALPAPQPPKVTVAAPLVRQVQDVDEFTGRIEAEQSVDVRARVTGYLKEIYFGDGDFVQAGDPLFLIDPSTYQAEYDQSVAKIDLWEAKHKFADATRARNAKLRQGNSVSLEEYEESVAAANEALAARRSAEADAARSRINLEFTKVVAPIGGRIDRRYVTVGNLVESGPGGSTSLTTIVTIDPVFVYFNPDELAFLKYTRQRVSDDGRAEAQHLRDRQLTARIVLADGTEYSEPGQIDFAANRVDPATGTIQVRAVFPNPRRQLSPGLFVRVKVPVETAYEAILVPERAIGTDQSEKFVYVVDAQNVAQRRTVELGTKHGRLRAIKAGLAATDRVVISGTLLVRPEKPVQPTEGQIDATDVPDETITQLRPPLEEADLPSGEPPTLPSGPRER